MSQTAQKFSDFDATPSVGSTVYFVEVIPTESRVPSVYRGEIDGIEEGKVRLDRLHRSPDGGRSWRGVTMRTAYDGFFNSLVSAAHRFHKTAEDAARELAVVASGKLVSLR